MRSFSRLLVGACLMVAIVAGASPVFASELLQDPNVTLLAWGLLADRVGERVVLAAGLAGCGAGLLVAAFAPSFGVLVVALALGGASGASVNAASGRAVMSWFGRYRAAV